MHYLLFNEVVDRFVERRKLLREAHFVYARRAVERSERLLGGALVDPVDGAVLLFSGDSPRVAEDFAEEDLFVKGGLITRWYVREWTTVVGPGAAVEV